jgi:hypothetical protein
MSRPRILPAAVAGAAALALAGCLSTGRSLSLAVGQYESAADIGRGKIVPGPGTRSLIHEWQAHAIMPNGEIALVESSGSRVKVLHPFDKSLHVFYPYAQNYYPCELRQSADRRFLYLEIEGQTPGGMVKDRVVLVYDLVRRSVIGRAAVGFRRP